jgi:hypothetical protein
VKGPERNFWTVTDAQGRRLAVVHSSHKSGVKWRLRCLDMWDLGWQVRQSTLEEYAQIVYVFKLLNGHGKMVYWIS